MKLDDIETLMTIIPSNEEDKLLREFKGEESELAKPERYLIKVKILNFSLLKSLDTKKELNSFISLLNCQELCL